jgi:hypothetical protein
VQDALGTVLFGNAHPRQPDRHITTAQHNLAQLGEATVSVPREALHSGREHVVGRIVGQYPFPGVGERAGAGDAIQQRAHGYSPGLRTPPKPRVV